MKVTFDKFNRTLAIVAPWIKTTQNELLEVELLDRGSPYALVTDESLVMNVRPKGFTDADLLAQATVAVSDYNSTSGRYELHFSAWTDAAKALLKIGDGNKVNDIAAPADVEIAMVYVEADATETESETQYGTLVRASKLPGDAALVALPGYTFDDDGDYLEVFKNLASIGRVQLFT